jgi:hypothetical protein
LADVVIEKGACANNTAGGVFASAAVLNTLADVQNVKLVGSFVHMERE